ncbi:MAG: dephospho-CoA kinase [Ruminococcaceae bacterium]|nr:dephospho-CoA kinase [Oscillospiraceae bacterium]
MAIVIGLTGGTGTGKSTVSAYLQTKAAQIIDADRIARKLTEPGSSASAAIINAFPSVALPDGSFDRKALGALVFSDFGARDRLNSLVHPAVLQEIKRQLSASQASLVVVDAPLLFECGLDSLCHVTIGIIADRARRLERITARDALSPAAASARIKAQPEDDFYRSRCDYILENNTDTNDLYQKIDVILKELAP